MIRTLALTGILSLVASVASAQQYQKAKDVLKGMVIRDSFIYQSSNLNSKKIIQIPRNSPVLIFGKKGNFLDVKYQSIRGWGTASSFSIQGTAPLVPQQVQQEQPRVEPTQTVSEEPVRVRKNTSELPARLNPYLTYVAKGKSFDKQLRLGFEATYALNADISLGGVADFVFLKGRYIDFGPIFRRQWDNQSAFFNPSMYVGLLYYSFNHEGDKDEGFGVQWALENDIPIMQNNTLQPSISTKIGADMMFFYFDEVRIPFWLSIGAAFRF